MCIVNINITGLDSKTQQLSKARGAKTAQERRIGVDVILSSYVKKISLIIISNKECFTKEIHNIVERNHQKGQNNNFYGGTSEKIPSAQNPI